MKATLKTLSTSVALACCALTVAAQAEMLEGTDVKFSGYIKLDAMVSDYSEGSLGHKT